VRPIGARDKATKEKRKHRHKIWGVTKRSSTTGGTELPRVILLTQIQKKLRGTHDFT
jgi:hypothetical protein